VFRQFPDRPPPKSAGDPFGHLPAEIRGLSWWELMRAYGFPRGVS
jgi:hypothetical protein